MVALGVNYWWQVYHFYLLFTLNKNKFIASLDVYSFYWSQQLVSFIFVCRLLILFRQAKFSP